MEREALRARTTELLEALRMDDRVPQAIFELLEIYAARLDRLELGEFPAEETPTKPERRASSGGMNAVKASLAERVGEIFDEAKGKKP